jgi:hypothetical protein
MTRQCCGIRRVPLASLCWLVGPALLAGCAWERSESPRGSIKDPIARASTATAARNVAAAAPAKQPQPRAQAPQPQDPRTCHDVPSCEALLLQLTCGELAVAMQQLRSVPDALRSAPVGSRPEDVVRATRLAAEVHEELRAENDARCRAASPPPDRTARPPAASAPPAAPAPVQPQPPPAATAPPVAPAPAQPPTSPTPGQPDAQPTPAQPERRPEQQ